MSRARGVLVLLLLAGSGIAATAWLQRFATPLIATQQKALQSQKILSLLLPGSYDNQPLDQPLALAEPQLATSRLLAGYRATRAARHSAILLHSQVQGYGGPIQLLIAIGANGKLLAIKPLAHNESPGLGAQIALTPNPWLASFAGKSLGNPAEPAWALKKDNGQFDQLAGATLTSRATVSAVHDALRYFDEHRAQLLGEGAHD